MSLNLDAMEAVARRMARRNWTDQDSQDFDDLITGKSVLALISRIREFEEQVNGSSQDHALTAGDARPSTRPEGWVSMPPEMTDEMIRASLAVEWPATYREHLRHPHDGEKSRQETERRIERERKRYLAITAARPHD